MWSGFHWPAVQGRLTVEEGAAAGRGARAELPEDGKGLYKGYLCGTGGRALLGTFLPEDGRLKLRRTLSLDELRRQGAWPPTGARAELAFSAGSPGGPHPPEGWHGEEAPARRRGEPLPARAAGGGRALYRPEPEGFSLAFPYAETRAFPLTPLFCFARVERMNGEFYAVFPFWSGRLSLWLPHKPAQAGQTIGANQTKEETRHGEPNHQGADPPCPTRPEF